MKNLKRGNEKSIPDGEEVAGDCLHACLDLQAVLDNNTPLPLKKGRSMKDNLAVVKGVMIGIILGAFAWAIIIWGGMYVWKNFLRPTESKISHVFEIERSSYVK